MQDLSSLRDSQGQVGQPKASAASLAPLIRVAPNGLVSLQDLEHSPFSGCEACLTLPAYFAAQRVLCWSIYHSYSISGELLWPLA